MDKVVITIVGKYTSLTDSYMSLIKSLEHAALFCNRKLEIQWINAVHLEEFTEKNHPVDFHSAWSILCSSSYVT